MAASGLLQGSNAVFYHPLDNNKVEDTQGQTWTGSAGSTAGKIGTAESAISADALSFGLAAEFHNSSATQGEPAIAVLSSTKVVVIYNDGLAQPNSLSRVGTVSGNSLTWGAAVTLATPAGSGSGRFTGEVIAMDSSTVVAIYTKGSLTRLKVGTVSGTILTWGALFLAQQSGDWGSAARNTLTKLTSTKFVVRLTGAINGNDVRIGEISGTTITLGSFVDIPNTGFDSLTTLTSTKFVAAWWTPFSGGSDAQVAIGTVSGLNATFGPVSTVKSQASSSQDHVCVALDNSTLLSGYTFGSPSRTGQVSVGTVSGTSVTWGSPVTFHGPAQAINTLDIVPLSSTKAVLVYRDDSLNGSKGVSKIVTVSGTTVSFGAKSEFTSGSDTALKTNVNKLTSTSVIVTYIKDSGASQGTGKIGLMDFTASLTAPTPAAYPSTIGATRIATAFWANNLTKGDATATIERGYNIVLTNTTISLGGTTAVWNVTLPINDDISHFVVLDFANTGGTNWNLHTSVDGAVFTDQGVQDSGTQAVTTVDTPPNVSLTDPAGDAGQWLDEAVLWSNNDLFTASELDNLFELADTFGEPMSQFQSQFGAPVCWQATATVAGGHWNGSGAGPCPAVIRVPRGATDVVVTDNGAGVFPRILEG